VEIGPFTGDVTEGFESYPPGGHPGPYAVYDGQAMMDDPLSHTVVIAFNWTGPGGYLEPYAGSLMGGTPAAQTVLEFAQPLYQFGGYFSTNSGVADGTVSFFDEGGDLIEAVELKVDNLVWAWQGWSSDVPIWGIEIASNFPPGGLIQQDDMQVTWVPEPSALTLLVVGAGLALRRR
jgi:hypothetical protein